MGASTIKDVARKAAVSVGTVSKYLNGLPCSPGRSARIKEAIELLNYKRNPFARSTRTAKSYCIGLVVEKASRDDSPLWIEGWLSSMLYALSAMGYKGNIYLLNGHDPDFSPEIFHNNVDGLITFGQFSDLFWEKMQQGCTLPIVTYLEKLPYSNAFTFPVSMEKALRALAEDFYSSGHRQIAVIGQPEGTALQKAQIFMDAFHKLNPEENKVMHLISKRGISQMDQGYSFTEQILLEHPEITGIFYTTDNLACNGLCALMRYRKRVPDEISVASYDHTVWAQNFHPLLTSVGIGYDKMAQSLTEYLYAILSGNRKKAEKLRNSSIELLYFPGKSIGKVEKKSKGSTTI